MKVLFILDSFQETPPGMAVYRICLRLEPERRLSIGCVSLGRGGPLEGRLQDLGIGARVLPFRGARDFRGLRNWARNLSARNDRPDVVHSFCAWPDLPARLICSAMEGIPLASSIGYSVGEDLSPVRRFIHLMLDRLTRRWGDVYVASSENHRQEMIRRGYSPDAIRVIPMGIDAVQSYPLSDASKAKYRRIMGVPEDVPLIVSEGEFLKVKGHEDLLAAMPRVLREHPEARLYLIGEGPNRPALQEAVQRLGLEENVRLIGPLMDLLPKILSTADLLVLPSRREIFPLVVAEAQAAGTPVVVTRAGSIPELVRDGETGIIIPSNDPDAMAATISALLANPGERERMGREGRTFMLENYELSETIDAYVALWRELAPEAEYLEEPLLAGKE